INKLANAQERFAPGHVEKFGSLRVGCSCVNFLVRIAQLNAIIVFEYSKEGIAVKWSREKFGKLSCGNVAGLKRERFFGSVTKALKFDDRFGGGKRQTRGDVGFIVDQFAEKNLGCGNETAPGHLFGVAHQLVEVNFRLRDKSANAAAALDDAFTFEIGECVARGHEADFVKFGEIALGSNRIARAKMASVNAFANGRLNALIRRNGGVLLGGHDTHLRIAKAEFKIRETEIAAARSGMKYKTVQPCPMDLIRWPISRN